MQAKEGLHATENRKRPKRERKLNLHERRITINAVLFYLKDKNIHKYCSIIFNILFNVTKKS